MAGNTTIEWTQKTWNPVTGCTKYSQGCKHCYAARMANRLKAMGNPRYTQGFNIQLHHDLLDVPRQWNKPQLIFVNSMSDLFHEEVPLHYIQSVFQTMVETPWHTYQVLTKRAERLQKLAAHLPWPKNVWMGTSVENQEVIHRINHLRQTPAHLRFLSLEPLLGPLTNLNLLGIDWVIVGGESGPKARPMEAQWVRDIRDQCLSQQVPFFFKQWGGTNKKKTGNSLDGRVWQEFPSVVTSYGEA